MQISCQKISFVKKYFIVHECKNCRKNDYFNGPLGTNYSSCKKMFACQVVVFNVFYKMIYVL